MEFSVSVESGEKPSQKSFGLTWLLVLTFLLLVLNVAFFLNRSWEDSYFLTSYAKIYYPLERPVISEWQEVEGGIEAVMSWNAEIEGWEINRDGEPYTRVSGKDLMIPAPPEDDDVMHHYVAAPQPEGIGPDLEFEIRFLPTSFHEERGLPRPDAYIIRTDVPITDLERLAVGDWVDDYDYMSETELEAVDAILRNQAGITGNETTFNRLEKLTAHFRGTIGKECRGTPPPDFRWKTPLQIYREMEAGESKGWCTQHAQMFVFFANRAGLSTRLVQGARTQGNNFIFTGHTWVEAWIPDQKRWAWLDPSFGLVYATDRNGQVLNTVELADLRRHAAWDGVTARVHKDWGWPDLEGLEGSFVDTEFPNVGGVVERQFITSAIYKWRRPPNVEDIRSDYGMLFKNREFLLGNLERYYFKPPLAYANFPAEGNRIYWLRHFLLWSFVVSLVATIVTFGGRRIRDRNPVEANLSVSQTS